MYSIIRQDLFKTENEVFFSLKHSLFVSFFLYHLFFIFLYMTTCGLLIIMYVFDKYSVGEIVSFER